MLLVLVLMSLLQIISLVLGIVNLRLNVLLSLRFFFPGNFRVCIVDETVLHLQYLRREDWSRVPPPRSRG